MTAESKMYEEVAITFAEIVKNNAAKLFPNFRQLNQLQSGNDCFLCR